MLAYIGRRALLAIFTVWAISVLAFAIIQLPPGDYVTSYIAQMASMGSVVTDEEAQNLRIQYGLGQPIYVHYYKRVKLIAVGNFGMSMEWRRPVTEVIGERLWLTVAGSASALILTWALALPIGIYSSVRQYSVGDYVATCVVTARAKGLSEIRVILRYPVRVALNPFASTIGYTLPYIVSGSIIVSLVLGLPTVGPLLLKALIAQDMFLAGTIMLLLGVMTVIGTLISDIVLVWIDPRIRLEET